MKKIVEGQKLWYVPTDGRDKPHEITVGKVGRRWAETGYRLRIDVETLEADGGKYSSPGRCWITHKEGMKMSQWQPIETAPKELQWIIAYRPPTSFGSWDTFVPVVWHAETGDFIWPDRSVNTDPYTKVCEDEDWINGGDFYEGGGSFTHWMPLPEPPTT